MTDFPYAVNDAVRLLKNVGDAPSGDSPGGTFGIEGETVIVRRICPESKIYPVYVSHADITDNSFGVDLSEIEPKPKES